MKAKEVVHVRLMYRKSSWDSVVNVDQRRNSDLNNLDGNVELAPLR